MTVNHRIIDSREKNIEIIVKLYCLGSYKRVRSAGNHENRKILNIYNTAIIYKLEKVVLVDFLVQYGSAA